MPKEKATANTSFGCFQEFFKSSLLLGSQSKIQKQDSCNVTSKVHTGPWQQLAQNKRLGKSINALSLFTMDLLYYTIV